MQFFTTDMRAWEADFFRQVQQIWNRRDEEDLSMFCWNSLSDGLWAAASLAAWSHFDLRSMISTTQQLLVIGISFLFPQTMRTHRANRSIEKFVATLMTIQGFLQVRLQRSKRWAKQIAHLTVSPFREALIEHFLGSFAINQCLRFLRQAVKPWY